MSESVDGLKQRLVGAFVILSLAVIFLPMLFDKPHHEANSAVELIPPKPQMETVIISKPKEINVVMPVELEDLERDPATKVPKKHAASSAASAQAAVKQIVPAAQKSVAKIDATKVSQKNAAAKAVATKKKAEKVYSNVWMVQLGTFSKHENAYALRDRLRKSGIKAHTKPLEAGDALRVFAGPFVTKKEALRIKRKVDGQFQVQSLLVYFEA